MRKPRSARYQNAMLRRVVLLAAVALSLSNGLADAGGGSIYTGGSPKARRQMQIYLDLLADHRAKWDVNMETPCMGRAIGTGSRPTEPLLRLLDGRFRLHRSKTVKASSVHYSYTLEGHRITDGFAGTLQYVERDGIFTPRPTTCASTLLHWTAHRGGIFR
jgi:hypothetical protein